MTITTEGPIPKAFEEEPVVKGDLLDRYLSVIVNRPHQCCVGGCCTLFVLMVLSIATGSMNMTLDQEAAWSVHTADFTRIRTALVAARTEAGYVPAGRRLLEESEHMPELRASAQGGEQGLLRSLSRHLASMGLGEDVSAGGSARRLQGLEEDNDGLEDLDLFYKVDDGNVFAPKHLAEMCRFEKYLFDGGVCDSTCKAWSGSPALLFYGGNLTDCTALPQASVDSVVAMMYLSVNQSRSDSPFARLLHPDFATTGRGPMAKSTYRVKKAETVVFDQMFQHFDPPLSYGFLRSAFMADEDRFAKLSVTSGGLKIRIFYEFDDFTKMIGPDFGLAIVSFVFVYLCMWSHLGSCFMASIGMFQILASLPVSSIIYRQIFMVDYFDFLHILTVYLVLGIGADDVFVLMDSWRHITADPKYADDVHGALRITWLRTSSAVFWTSFTTAVAFLSMSVSRVMPMRTCGWYAAICIFMNYIFVISFTPACLMVYQLRFQGKRGCCPNPASREAALSADRKASQGGCITLVVERFIQKAYLPLMKAGSGSTGGFNMVSGALVAIMLGVGAQGAYFTAQLTPPSAVEEWFPDNHMWTNFTEFVVESSYQPNFKTFDEMSFVWGIQDLDFATMNPYKPDDEPGKPIFDASFDLSTPEAQARVLQVCQDMRDIACDLKGCRNFGTGKLAMSQGSLVGVSCFLEDMQLWLNGTALPTGSAFLPALLQFRSEADAAALGADTHGELVEANYMKDIGVINGQLKFVTVVLRSTLPNFEPFGTGVKVRDMVADFVERARAGSPASLKSFQVSSDQFGNFDLGAELISSLFSSCAIALPCSFIVILISTRNFVLASYAVSAVAFIVLSVLGFCKSAMGWDLGIAEAIAGVIVIGYSIDYVIHLANIYTEADHHGLKTRTERAAFAIENMGSTVFAGAITTAGSGAFMFACFLTFFFKMAILICVTIMYSFLFSLLYFMGLAFFVGPAHNQGDILCACCVKAVGSPIEPPKPEKVEEVAEPNEVQEIGVGV